VALIILPIICPMCLGPTRAKGETPVDLLIVDEHDAPMRFAGDDPDSPCSASCLDVATAGANALRIPIEHFNQTMLSTTKGDLYPYWRRGLKAEAHGDEIVIVRHRDPAFVASGDRDELILSTTDPHHARMFLHGMMMLVDLNYALRWQGRPS
jgi:hypothetical protein